MQETVYYSQFGAVGDGKTDDFKAICAAHEYANAHKLTVKADKGATYYIGQSDAACTVKTSTDWTDAEFIIDDSEIFPGMPMNIIFNVVPSEDSIPFDVKSLKKGQKHLGFAPGRDYHVIVENDKVINYIRKGAVGNNGCPQTDNFVVTADGDILNDIIWNFDEITAAYAKPIEEELVIKGGKFTTIANRAEPQCGYYQRNIYVSRTHVTIDGLTHEVVGEGEQGMPYAGFITVVSTAYVMLKNLKLSEHKIYYMSNVNGVSRLSIGTYDLNLASTAFITLDNITQNDILDVTKWGLMCTNFCKDFVMKNSAVSRFDAHMGVTNCTITNCKLGWMCLNAIGHGVLTVEGSELYGGALVYLRPDYGAFWDGDMYIKDCVWHPHHKYSPAVINAENAGLNDFGHECMMPRSVTINNLRIADGNFDDEYQGSVILSDYDNHPELPDKLKIYTPTQKLTVHNLVTDSGIPCKVMAAPERYPSLICDIDEGSCVKF